MPSTNKTENFELNQWIRTDGISMDDFNADNSKIDTAIACRAQMVAGSYMGNGKYGSSNPCTLTFDFEPKLVIIYKAAMGFITGSNSSSSQSYTIIAAAGATTSTRFGNNGEGSMSITDYFTWDGNSFSWYSEGYYDRTQGATGSVQLNESGTTYYYVAIG